MREIIYGTKKVGLEEKPLFENDVPVTDYNEAAQKWVKFVSSG